MPDRPDDPDQKAGGQDRETLDQSRQKKSTPPEFFAKRPEEKRYKKGRGAEGQQGRWFENDRASLEQ